MVFYSVPNTPAPPGNGGQVVKMILSEAIESAGHSAEIMGPTFAHVTLHIVVGPATTIQFSRQNPFLVNVTVPAALSSPVDIASWVYSYCRPQCDEFYSLSNIRTRILFVVS